MYDSTKIKQQDTPITLDYILSKVTEYDIYARYIGQFKIGFIYNGATSLNTLCISIDKNLGLSSKYGTISIIRF